MAAQLTAVRFFTLMHRRDVYGQVVLLTKPLLAERAGIRAMLFVYRFDVLFKVVLPLEAVRADCAYVCLGPVGFLMHRWLMGLHDVGTQVMPLQKTLIAQVTTVRFDLLFGNPN